MLDRLLEQNKPQRMIFYLPSFTFYSRYYIKFRKYFVMILKIFSFILVIPLLGKPSQDLVQYQLHHKVASVGQEY